MYCNNCGAEVKEDAKFCPRCGFNLIECRHTENSLDSLNNEPKSKSKGYLSFLDDWNEWNRGKKIGSIILACCIGLIIIGTIGGIIFPDLNTSEKRFYMTDSSFVIPDGCTIRESGNGPATAILIQDDGQEVFVNDYYPKKFDSSDIIDSNETINVDGVNVYKIKYHYRDGLTFTDYLFNKDNIDYCIVFNHAPDENLAISIVKSMDTTHGSSNDHKNVYPSSSDTSSSSSSNSNVNSASDKSDSDDGVGDSDIQVRIKCKGSWKGEIGVGTSSSTYSGKGNKLINLDGSSSDFIAAVIQKQSGGNGKLKVEIIKKGKVVNEGHTTSGYGIVSVSD